MAKAKPVEVKICGLTTEEAVDAAVEAGTDYVGLVFFPPSPRNVSPERAAELIELLPEEVAKVGLFVDADDALLDEVMTHLRLDLLQFHGNETPERVEQVRLEYGVPVMKVIHVSEPADLSKADAYLQVADRLMFDAKPPKDATRPGGNAVAFDWSILAGKSWKLPWFLAGGLTPANVADAIKATNAPAVDVSSGVESAPGVKDLDLIAAFVKAAKG
jgi:phosphoribosylanthranilate isomerase